jgi:hypothetical protein
MSTKTAHLLRFRNQLKHLSVDLIISLKAMDNHFSNKDHALQALASAKINLKQAAIDVADIDSKLNSSKTLSKALRFAFHGAILWSVAFNLWLLNSFNSAQESYLTNYLIFAVSLVFHCIGLLVCKNMLLNIAPFSNIDIQHASSICSDLLDHTQAMHQSVDSFGVTEREGRFTLTDSVTGKSMASRIEFIINKAASRI